VGVVQRVYRALLDSQSGQNGQIRYQKLLSIGSLATVACGTVHSHLHQMNRTTGEKFLAIGMLALVPAVAACGSDVRERADDGSPAAAISRAQAANATYEGIYEDPVTLEDGSWEGEPHVPEGASRPSVWLLDRLWLKGDLSGDGSEEAAVLLAESSGGSGSYSYIAAMGRRDGELVNLGTALIGDRVQLRAMRLSGERIEVDVVQGGPDDAACCPTQKATRAWSLQPDGLVELPPQITGTLSIADLAGVEWRLTHFSWDDPAPADPEITFVVEGDQLSGSSGCNRYFGGIEEASTGELSLGPLGGTRMACPEEAMALETRYLEALAATVGYSFLAGRLALTYTVEEGFQTLLFDPRQP
jgi:heat shock protein HslJ